MSTGTPGWRTFSIRDDVHFQMDPADISRDRVISHSPEVTKALLDGDGAFLAKAKARKEANRQKQPAKSTQPALFKSISGVLTDADPAQREAAIRALAQFRTEQEYGDGTAASPTLFRLQDREPRSDREIAMQLLQSSNPATRESAWRYLRHGQDRG